MPTLNYDGRQILVEIAAENGWSRTVAMDDTDLYTRWQSPAICIVWNTETVTPSATAIAIDDATLQGAGSLLKVRSVLES